MDNKEFWRLIKVAYEQSEGDEKRQASLLVSALVALGTSAIIAFGTFYKRFVALVTERVDVSDTDLCDNIKGELYLTTFGYWLVGQGESEYYRGLAANDAHDAEQVSDIGIFTALEHVVPTAYHECTGQDHPDWLGFSEYLAAGSGRDKAASASFDEPDLHDWGTPLHHLRRSLPSQCDSLHDGVLFLLNDIADLYYRLPKWKQKTEAGTLLAKAGNMTSEFYTLLGELGFDLSDSLERLVPDEPLRAPEGPTRRSTAE